MLFAALLLLTGGTNMLQVGSREENDSDDTENGANMQDESTEKITSKQEINQFLDLQPSCPRNWNGVMEHPTSCTLYHRCEDGSLSLLECEDSQVFDPKTLECSTTAVCEKRHQNQSSQPCQRQADGLYPSYAESCKHYFRCEHSYMVGSQSCPSGQAFSFSRQACLPQHQVSCIQPICHPDEDNFYWFPGSFCRSYYFCERGTPYVFLCPEGKVFDRTTRDCREGSQCYEPICTGKKDGNHSDTTHDCRRSLDCKGGVLHAVRACPPGQRHDGKFCLPEKLVTCDDPASTAVAVEAIKDDCSGYSDGPHVIAASKCRRYQVCQDGKALARLECPLGKVFDGEKCVPEGDIQCEEVCEGKMDGYHADTTEGCRKYFYCRNGRITERRSCPDGSLFSGRMCLPTPLVSCEQLSQRLGNPCLGLSDGFHADYLRGCTDYFYCSGYNVALRSTCLQNTVWNGQQCVDPKDNLCTAPEPSSLCHGLPTGLYQDKASGCSKYYYCHNGNRTLLMCPKNYIFNGEACVSNEEYTCPSREPYTCYNKTDGYRIDKESGCHAYYYCSNNEKITYICQESQVFNGTMCTSPENFTCPFSAEDCSNKQNGYYPAENTGCRKYFYCHKGYKLTTISCGHRKVFDGTKCVLTSYPAEVCKMAILQQNSCERNNRPISDLTSQCRKYQYCSKNRRVTALCQLDYVFNGEQCVAPAMYKCPNVNNM